MNNYWLYIKQNWEGGRQKLNQKTATLREEVKCIASFTQIITLRRKGAAALNFKPCDRDH